MQNTILKDNMITRLVGLKTSELCLYHNMQKNIDNILNIDGVNVCLKDVTPGNFGITLKHRFNADLVSIYSHIR